MNATLKNYLLTHVHQLATLATVVLAAFTGLVPADAASLGALMLLNTEGGDAAAPGGASPAPTNTPSEANGGGKPTPAAGDDSGKPAPAAAASKKEESQLPRSKGAVAHERAAARIAKANAAKAGKPNSSAAAPAQDTDPGKPGAGTEGKPGDGKQAAPPGAGDAGQEKPPAGDAPSASDAKAPETWSADRQAKFNALTPEARTVVSEFHKEMSAGVTHVLTQLSEERSRHQDLFALNEKFNSGQDGAREVLTALAKQANVELFFERPEAEEKIPEDALADPAKLARYIEDRAVKRAEKANAAVTETAAKQAQAATAKDQLTREFQDVAKAHTDFATHKPAVMQVLQKAPSLSVEEAYRVVTHDALVKLANETPALKQKLAAVETELAALKKKATTLPANHGGGAPSGEDKFLSPGQRAFKNAEAKRAARGARA